MNLILHLIEMPFFSLDKNIFKNKLQIKECELHFDTNDG